jgi:beta-barrel assembly-enhancing protease
MKKLLILSFTALSLGLLSNCSKNPDDNSINIYSIDDDISLGKQVKAEIAANPTDYPLLDETQYADAYTYIRGIVTKIKDGGKVFYNDKFAWETYIIHDDSVLNAFCVPGGYMYVYTGLIKYMKSEDELAGVMGHEMAHADRRHTTDQMTKQYGLELMLSVALGNSKGTLTTIAENMLLLKYSRDAEREADKYSVTYLCPTDYKADGFSNFFAALAADGQNGNKIDAFFSTHPSPDERVKNITDEKTTQACSGTGTFDDVYANFKNNLIP